MKISFLVFTCIVVTTERGGSHADTPSVQCLLGSPTPCRTHTLIISSIVSLHLQLFFFFFSPSSISPLYSITHSLLTCKTFIRPFAHS